MLLLFLALTIWGFAKRSQKLMAVGLAGMFLSAWPPAAWLWAQPLEAWYQWNPPAPGAQAIVVLAAGAEPAEIPELPDTLKENSTVRCRHALYIWKKYPQLPVLTCGGLNPRLSTPVAAIMKRTLAEGGIPEAQLWTEERSTSTYENALFGAEILRKKGIKRVILVTEAYHMLRSERCFRKQGMQVFPAACNFTTIETDPNGFVPDALGLGESEQTLHEIFGLGWYLVRGRI